MFGILKIGKLGASMKRAGLNPSTLFAASEPGAWYDPSDMSTLFQDSAGTVPVTAVEQPVGLLLDKSKGLVRGAELHTAMQNASTWSFADFSAAGTGFSGSGAVMSGIGAAVGANTFSVVAGSSYEVMVDVASKTSHTFQLGLSTGTQGANGVISTRAYITSIGVTSLVLTALSSGVVRLEFNNGGEGSGASIVVTSISIRELPGNHATQATTTKRPIYSRRVNTFTRSEFQDGVIGGAGLVSIASLAGYAGAVSFGHNGVTTSYAYKSASHLNGFSAILSVVIQMTDGGVPVTNSSAADADFMLVISGNMHAGASVVSLGGDFYRVISQPTVITASNTGVVKYASNSSRTFKVTAYDLRLATDAHLPYQWVNTDTDYDADPAKYPAYLRFDGVDDALQTGNINFTGTDKMTVWAGVTKLSDAANALVYEFGSPESVNDGSFSMWAPINLASAPLGVTAKGIFRSVAATVAFSGVASGVVAQDISLSAPRNALRVNGATLSTETTALGGSFGNYPLYIGARDGTSLYFNGRLYSLIVRGAQSSLSQIEATERYIKQKMRLP